LNATKKPLPICHLSVHRREMGTAMFHLPAEAPRQGSFVVPPLSTPAGAERGANRRIWPTAFWEDVPAVGSLASAQRYRRGKIQLRVTQGSLAISVFIATNPCYKRARGQFLINFSLSTCRRVPSRSHLTLPPATGQTAGTSSRKTHGQIRRLAPSSARRGGRGRGV